MKDGQEIPMPADGEGYYEIEVPDTDDDLTVTAENTYLCAELSIRKVDGEDGSALSGADFNIYDGTGGVPDPDKDEPISGITFSGKDGVYTARIPLEGTEAHTFYIFEKTAPEGYPKEEALSIKAELVPGQKITASEWQEEWAKDNATMLENYIFPNYRGAYVDLVKYGNVREGNPTEDDVMSGVTLKRAVEAGSKARAGSQTRTEKSALPSWAAGLMQLQSLRRRKDIRGSRGSGLREQLRMLKLRQQKLPWSTGRQ